MSLPGIGLFQRTLFPSVCPIRVTHTLTIAKGVFAIEKQGFVHSLQVLHSPFGQTSTCHLG